MLAVICIYRNRSRCIDPPFCYLDSPVKDGSTVCDPCMTRMEFMGRMLGATGYDVDLLKGNWDRGRLYLFLWILGSENVLKGMMSRMPFSCDILLVIMR